jgi:hypothetical protein
VYLIYYCNEGPDRAVVMSQGRLADRRLEKLARSDLAIIRFRKMMEQAYARERGQKVSSRNEQVTSPSGPDGGMTNGNPSLAGK